MRMNPMTVSFCGIIRHSGAAATELHAMAPVTTCGPRQFQEVPHNMLLSWATKTVEPFVLRKTYADSVGHLTGCEAST